MCACSIANLSLRMGDPDFGYLFWFFILQEIYSIKLPGNPKLGEGKPENQNHAVIFTRGNAVQTIDMNQVTECCMLCFWYMSVLTTCIHEVVYLCSSTFVCYTSKECDSMGTVLCSLQNPVLLPFI